MFSIITTTIISLDMVHSYNNITNKHNNYLSQHKVINRKCNRNMIDILDC